MKILMTGGSGFLGKYVEKESLFKGHTFLNYDISSGKDILNQSDFYAFCASERPDVIIHAAAIADLYESEKNADKNFSINVFGTYLIGRICSILEIPLIYISTCCAYGNQSKKLGGVEISEDDEAIPTESYAWSKLAGEKALGCVGPLTGFILRLGTFYGPEMRDALFNCTAIDKIANGEKITIHGDGSQTRKYIHAKDISEAIVLFCEKSLNKKENEEILGYRKNPLPIFNIIGDEEISVLDTISTIEKILGKKAIIELGEERNGQIKRQMINYNRAMSFIKWRPKIKYVDGMRECINARLNKNNA